MTKIFLDTANLDEIEEIRKWGITEGITTNQKIFLKEKGVDFEAQSKEILELVAPDPVSLEGPNDLEGILKFAYDVEEWREFGYQFENRQLWTPVIKVPMLANGDGLRAIKSLMYSKMKTNATACITLNQVFLAINAGADYVSLFYNRMIDYYQKENKISREQARYIVLDIIFNAQKMIDKSKSGTKLIVGSIRSAKDIEDLLTRNPDFITIPYKILKEMPVNSKTIETLKEFEDAWKEFNDTKS